MRKQNLFYAVRILKIRRPPKNCCNHPKIRTTWLYYWVMHPKDADVHPTDADVMANSVDDETSGVVWSGSTLFAQNRSVQKLRNIMVCTKGMMNLTSLSLKLSSFPPPPSLSFPLPSSSSLLCLLVIVVLVILSSPSAILLSPSPIDFDAGRWNFLACRTLNLERKG